MKTANIGPTGASAALATKAVTLHGVHWVGQAAGVGTLTFRDALTPTATTSKLTINTPNTTVGGFVPIVGGGMKFGTAISVSKTNAAVTIVYATA